MTAPRPPLAADQRGTALLLVITLILLLAAVGAAMAVASRTETLIAANFRQGRETLYAAEGAAARGVRDLAGTADWSTVLSGSVASSFTDGPSIGARSLPGGGTVTLCCGRPSLTDDVQQRALGGRSWGADTPRWQIYAWGPVTNWLAAGRIDSAMYAVVWVADDPEDGDGNPALDSNGIVLLHSHALGPAGGRRVVDVLVGRPLPGEDPPQAIPVRIISWREVRW